LILLVEFLLRITDTDKVQIYILGGMVYPLKGIKQTAVPHTKKYHTIYIQESREWVGFGGGGGDTHCLSIYLNLNND
jgi:hypothetical protein